MSHSSPLLRLQGIVDSGAKAVAVGAAIGEMAMHFIEKAGLMVIRCLPSRSIPNPKTSCTARGELHPVRLALLFWAWPSPLSFSGRPSRLHVSRVPPSIGKPAHPTCLLRRRRIPSKFDLRRFTRAVGATAMVSLGEPRAEELGFAGKLEVQEVGGANVTVISQVRRSLAPCLPICRLRVPILAVSSIHTWACPGSGLAVVPSVVGARTSRILYCHQAAEAIPSLWGHAVVRSVVSLPDPTFPHAKPWRTCPTGRRYGRISGRRG